MNSRLKMVTFGIAWAYDSGLVSIKFIQDLDGGAYGKVDKEKEG
jgi:hypothetical protein